MSRYVWMEKHRGPHPARDIKELPHLVLILCRYDFSGIGYHLSRAINQNIEGWESRCIVEREHNFKWPYDLLSRKKDRHEIRSLIDRAHYILFSSSAFFVRPLDYNLPLNIPWGIQHGGTYYRMNYKDVNELIHPLMDHVFCHSGLEGMDERNVYLPTAIDTDKYKPIKKNWKGKIIVGHTPSRQNVKLSSIFMTAKERLERKYGTDKIEFRLIEGKQFEDCMEGRKHFHIFFDQVNQRPQPEGAYRHYGTALIESACFETVCMVGTDKPELPLITVWNENDIIREINRFMDDRSQLKKLARKTRKWVVKKHGYKEVSERFMSHILKDQELLTSTYKRYETRNNCKNPPKEMISHKDANIPMKITPHAEVPKGKPLVLLIDSYKDRDPNITYFSERLTKGERSLQFIKSKNVHHDLSSIVSKLPRIPDIIYLGYFITYANLNRLGYWQFINTHRNIKVISETLDSRLFIRGNKIASKLEGMPISLFIKRDTVKDDEVTKAKSIYRNFRASKVLYLPWTIDPEIYYDMGIKRDVDFAYICTIMKNSKRENIRTRLLKMKNLKKIISAPFLKRKGYGERKYFGKDYIEALNRTKILIVVGGRPGVLKQKYLEAALCGAMIISDNAVNNDHFGDTFVNGESYIVCDVDKMPQRIRYYLKHEKRRMEIVAEARRRVLRDRHVDRACEIFENECMRLLQ